MDDCELLTVTDFAARCGVRPELVRRWLRRGVRLPLCAESDAAPGRITYIRVPYTRVPRTAAEPAQ